MKKTTFHISKMDCPSEEKLIRMKLDGYSVNKLEFDILNRNLYIYHDSEITSIFNAINELNLGASITGTEIINNPIIIDDYAKEKKLLFIVLLVNFLLFITEISAGFISDSMGLVADSLDMLADAIVYGLSLFAVGHHVNKKKSVAKISGYTQLLLASLGFIEVIRRFVGLEEVPEFKLMIIISILALIGNAYSLYLLQKSKSKEVHIQASMIFTSNDIIVNIGIILAALLVFITNSKYPDLIIGIIVFSMVAKGALRILKLSK
jgi:Co/Zn/Cd efflux system component